MSLKRIISAIVALFLGLFTGCKDNKANENYKLSDNVTGKVVITALNVGKADCFVIQSEKSVTMIDTGTEESAKIIEDFLDKNDIKHIDQLFISHFDKDHVGGADHIIKHYDVDKVYTTYYIAKESDDIDEYQKALRKRNMEPVLVDAEVNLRLDGIEWEMYPPEKDDYKKDVSNNSSMVVRMSYKKVSALFAADAQKARISELLKNDKLQSDIIKMPHHGGFEKNLDDLINLVQPKYAVLTDSNSDPEDDKTVKLLQEKGVQAFSVRNGNIVIKTDGKNINISQ